MYSKYGFNVDYIAEGPYHASIDRVLALPRSEFNKLTREEKDHILGEYSCPGSSFTLSENEDGELQVNIKQKQNVGR